MSGGPPLSPMAILRWAVVGAIIDELRPGRVLEIGCGQGGFGARIAARAAYVGVEQDEDSYQIARGRVEANGGIVHHGTLDQVDPDGAFDLLCAFEVLEHIDDDLAALGDWMRWVAPGGTVLVSVPAWPARYGASDELVGHYRRYTPDQLDSLLGKAGCDEIHHRVYGWPLGLVTEMVRNRIARRRVATASGSMAARTAGSGRFLQPDESAGSVIRVATAPFVVAQRLRPTAGVGLIGVGRRL